MIGPMDLSPRLERIARLIKPLLEPAPGPPPQSGGRPAGVLVPFWDDGARVQVVFTRRSQNLPHHAGQISFPGGAAEPQDPHLLATALRETAEEIGVAPEQVVVVGRVGEVSTVTGFLVRPFVGLLKQGVRFNPNASEVVRLVFVPLARVLDEGAYTTAEVDYSGARLTRPAVVHEGEVIWGATYRILLKLREVLSPVARELAAIAEDEGGSC